MVPTSLEKHLIFCYHLFTESKVLMIVRSVMFKESSAVSCKMPSHLEVNCGFSYDNWLSCNT